MFTVIKTNKSSVVNRVGLDVRSFGHVCLQRSGMSIDYVYVSLSMFTVRKSIRAMLRLNNPSVPLGMFAFKAAAPFPFE